jgi:inositol-1,4,5-trisphosphate 5-phosphatase
MSFPGTKMLIITSNLGTYFEEEEIQKNWLQVFDEFVTITQPLVIALHCQEVGGKHFQDSMDKVDVFTKEILRLPMMKNYDRSRCFLDKNAALLDTHFTALGSCYFIHQSVEGAEMWNFKANRFEPVLDHVSVTEDLDSDTYHIKEKFPMKFFPEVRWTRKGFMFSRWRLFGRNINFGNIHLFHDEDNLVSLDKAQSRYSGYRRHALLHTLDRYYCNLKLFCGDAAHSLQYMCMHPYSLYCV